MLKGRTYIAQLQILSVIGIGGYHWYDNRTQQHEHQKAEAHKCQLVLSEPMPCIRQIGPAFICYFFRIFFRIIQTFKQIVAQFFLQ